MARLSVEHYRANANMTPEHMRKSSRFRDMFRSRPSSSNTLVSPVTRSPPAKSTLSPPVSPTSPTVRPGFDKVGLLPSEQGSVMDVKQALEESGGSRVVQVLEKEVKELKGVSAPHTRDTELDVASMGHVDGVAKSYQETEHTREVNKIAEAFTNAMSKSKDEDAERSANVATGGDPVLSSVETKSPLQCLRHLQSHKELKTSDGVASSIAANGKLSPSNHFEMLLTHSSRRQRVRRQRRGQNHNVCLSF
jgi:hypothetical protein